MSRNSALRKCEKCEEITPHMRFAFRTWNKEGWRCSICDTLRDIESWRDAEFKGHTMEVLPMEIALDQEGDSDHGHEV